MDLKLFRFHLKMRMITSGALSVSASILLAMCIVTLILWKQGQQTAYQDIQRAITVTSSQLKSLERQLEDLAEHIGRHSQFANKAAFLRESKGIKKRSVRITVETGRRSLAEALYDLAKIARINQVILFDADGDWTCGVTISPQGAYLSYPAGRKMEKVMEAVVPPGASLEDEHWRLNKENPKISVTKLAVLPEHPYLEYQVHNGILSAEAGAPVIKLKINQDKSSVEQSREGMILVSNTIGVNFAHKIKELTGGSLSIFTGSELSVGEYRGYSQLEENLFSTLKKTSEENGNGMETSRFTFNQRRIPEGRFFEGLFPIMADGKPVAVFSLLFSQEISRKNIVKIVQYLIAAAVVSFLLILPFTWFSAARIAKPIQKLVNLAVSIRNGDLTNRSKMKRTDEIGQLADAMDEMADGLQGKAESAERIADGQLDLDLTLVSEKDVLGRALQVIIQNFNQIIYQVNLAVSQAADGASQVSDSSLSLSQGASEQASSIEEITSSLTEVSGRTETNAQNASLVDKMVVKVRGAAHNSDRHMHEMIAAMSDIKKSSQEIAKIIKTIDDIAFQTNLLALNAAVEAARAGKHGKGFAVVAQEVRNLANRSAGAARETADLIAGSVQKVENGSEIAGRTADALHDIVEGIDKVTQLVGEIASESRQQSNVLTQINQGLDQVEHVTQNNAANAEQTASTSEKLSLQAKKLQLLLTRFKLKNESTPPMIPESNGLVSSPEFAIEDTSDTVTSEI